MVRLRPRPFFIVGAMRKAVTLPVMPIFGEVPPGAPFRLDYILVSYKDVVVANAQTSPDVTCLLFDSRGVSLTGVTPLPIKSMCTPAGFLKLRGAVKWGIIYPARSIIRLDLFDQTATGPSVISVTFMGKKADEAR